VGPFHLESKVAPRAQTVKGEGGTSKGEPRINGIGFKGIVGAIDSEKEGKHLLNLEERLRSPPECHVIIGHKGAIKLYQL